MSDGHDLTTARPFVACPAPHGWLTPVPHSTSSIGRRGPGMTTASATVWAREVTDPPDADLQRRGVLIDSPSARILDG